MTVLSTPEELYKQATSRLADATLASNWKSDGLVKRPAAQGLSSEDRLSIWAVSSLATLFIGVLAAGTTGLPGTIISIPLVIAIIPFSMGYFISKLLNKIIKSSNSRTCNWKPSAPALSFINRMHAGCIPSDFGEGYAVHVRFVKGHTDFVELRQYRSNEDGTLHSRVILMEALSGKTSEDATRVRIYAGLAEDLENEAWNKSHNAEIDEAMRKEMLLAAAQEREVDVMSTLTQSND